MAKTEARTCPNCGNDFTCEGDFSCWCITLHIPGEIRDYISATFDGCLCRECIESIIKQAAQPGQPNSATPGP
jgi:hypothetical protein